MTKKYDSFDVREGHQKLDTELEESLMNILMDFGGSVDSHGYDGGDYDAAMDKLLKIVGGQMKAG